MVEFKGKRLTIRYFEQPSAEEDPVTWLPPSLVDSLGHMPAGTVDKIMATMGARRQLLADGVQLRSPDHWNTEGLLPNGKHFYAIKSNKLRAYGWFSSRHKAVFFISHFAFKASEKLSPEDANLVVHNWREIEE